MRIIFYILDRPFPSQEFVVQISNSILRPFDINGRSEGITCQLGSMSENVQTKLHVQISQINCTLFSFLFLIQSPIHRLQDCNLTHKISLTVR